MRRTKRQIGIVDLFSGPGGLGEGFSAFRDCNGEAPFKVEISIEKERSAHATLTLRSFLRQFPGGFPAEYYDFLNGSGPEPTWSELHPTEWKAAVEECRCLELGKPETSAFVKERIIEIRRKYGDDTLLMGGPPCQAYSLAGRSRNAGNSKYIPHKDERNFLYQEYVGVLAQLSPAAFVMENVKGMLSSAINGDGIFRKVMSDLQNAGGKGNYKLFALNAQAVQKSILVAPEPKDFIVKAEEFGVPQARHRVIIVGFREDIARKFSETIPRGLEKGSTRATVRDILTAMPRLRSGLSKGDSQQEWLEAVLHAADLVELGLSSQAYENRKLSREVKRQSNKLRRHSLLERAKSTPVTLGDACPPALREWYSDSSLKRLANNETRGHMRSDLARYLFSSAFATVHNRSPKAAEFPEVLAPNHKSWKTGKFSDRFRVQVWDNPASTITSHISKDGHYFIHPDPGQCRSLTVREAARLQSFPDNYFFKGTRTEQYVQVGNAVPPFLAHQIAASLWHALDREQGGHGSDRQHYDKWGVANND